MLGSSGEGGGGILSDTYCMEMGCKLEGRGEAIDKSRVIEIRHILALHAAVNAAQGPHFVYHLAVPRKLDFIVPVRLAHSHTRLAAHSGTHTHTILREPIIPRAIITTSTSQ